jgi:PAS domain S-box-containing protein
MLGKNPDELPGERLTSYLQPTENTKDWLQHLVARLEERNTVEGLQLYLRNGAGDLIEVEMSAGTVEIAGEPQYFQFILRDISANKEMERQLLESERLIGTSRQAAIFGLAKLAECRDDDTGAHLFRIRSYTCILCRELAKCKVFEGEITESFVDDILHSSALHDIGKVGIPDSILLKPGKLNHVEFELMKQHCIFGSETLSAADNFDETVSFLQIGRQVARSHHERWDGTGYPDGLTGDDIPLAARIIALADVYDALTSTRVYKPAYNHETTKEIIIQQNGKQFDPRIICAFLRVEHVFKEARTRLVVHQKDTI